MAIYLLYLELMNRDIIYLDDNSPYFNNLTFYSLIVYTFP